MAVVGETGANKPRRISRTCSSVAAVPLPDLARTESLMLRVAELLEDETPDPLDNDDVYTNHTEAIADQMKDVGEEIGAALNCTCVRRADKLAQALADAHSYTSWACACLEDEYAEAHRDPQPYCLLWHARRVLRVLQGMHAGV